MRNCSVLRVAVMLADFRELLWIGVFDAVVVGCAASTPWAKYIPSLDDEAVG